MAGRREQGPDVTPDKYKRVKKEKLHFSSAFIECVSAAGRPSAQTLNQFKDKRELSGKVTYLPESVLIMEQ